MATSGSGPIRAYAKINIGLFILRKRADGYHDIATVFHRVALYDEILLEPSPVLTLTGGSPEVPADHTNLCHRAASSLRDRLGMRDGVRISLAKNIPVGAGLGGGSADAAAVLLHLPSFWGVQADPAMLDAVALELGSDIPYFLRPGSATATGRGEVLEYFPLDIPFSIVLCYPGVAVSTAWAYQQVRPAGKAPRLRETVVAGMTNPHLLATQLRNDFESVVLPAFPAVAAVKRTMLDGGAVYASLSGSGSSVFGFFAAPAAAARVESTLKAQGLRTWLTPPHFQVP